MNKALKALNAVIGFAGSSENPSKMSLRFIGIITGVVTQFAPFISLILAHALGVEGADPAQVQQVLEPWVYVIGTGTAIFLWVIGAIRAGWTAYNVGARIQGIINK